MQAERQVRQAEVYQLMLVGGRAMEPQHAKEVKARDELKARREYPRMKRRTNRGANTRMSSDSSDMKPIALCTFRVAWVRHGTTMAPTCSTSTTAVLA